MSRELDEVKLETYLADVNKGLENCGYSIWDMGGNCTAYGKKFDDGSYVLITNDDGGSHILEGNILIGHYDDDEDCDPLCWEIGRDDDSKPVWGWQGGTFITLSN